MMLEIRQVRESDADSCLEIYRPLVEETAISFEVEPPSVAGMRERIAAASAGHPWLVAVSGERVEGYAYAGTFRNRAAYGRTAETTVYVRQDRRGLGIGRALYESLVACLRLQGFRTLVASIALPNAASVRLHVSVGYRSVGTLHNVGHKFGRWHDTEWFEMDLATASPGRLLTPGELTGTAEWAAAVAAGRRFLRS
jgi:phosphinothricin acetyltransferase